VRTKSKYAMRWIRKKWKSKIKITVSREQKQWKMKGKTESTFYEKKAFKKLLKEILYLDYETITPDFLPYLRFYKFLARKPDFASKDVNQFQKLRLWIPDTVVYNEADQPYWIYTNTEGLVCRSEDFYERHVVSKLGN